MPISFWIRYVDGCCLTLDSSLKAIAYISGGRYGVSSLSQCFRMVAFSYLRRPSNLYPEWRVYKQHAQWLMIAGLSLGLGVDCVIAFCVSYFLLRGRNQMFGPCVPLSIRAVHKADSLAQDARHRRPAG
jgi:hypothetical protein